MLYSVGFVLKRVLGRLTAASRFREGWTEKRDPPRPPARGDGRTGDFSKDCRGTADAQRPCGMRVFSEGKRPFSTPPGSWS